MATAWDWAEGPVDEVCEHLVLAYHGVGSWSPVARVSAPIANTFRVQFLLDPSDPAWGEAVTAVRAQLDFYLVEKREPDPWRYAQYHCGTGANIYSKVQWSYHQEAVAAKEHAATG